MRPQAAGELGDGEGAGGVGWRPCLAALAVFALALVAAYAGFWGADLRDAVPLPQSILAPQNRSMPATVPADYRLGVWALARNARVLVGQPLQLFEAEPCFPAHDTLALHHPVIGPALLALPFWVATGDPILTFNLARLAATLLAALAMFWLVTDWTREPAAGIASGLLYAFHVSHLGQPHHFFTVDDSWLLFALLFARRLCAHARWRDAFGLAASGGLMLATSIYPTLAAALVAMAFAAFCAVHYGPRRLLTPQLGVVALCVLGVALIVYAPYVRLSEEVLAPRARYYAPWHRFAPGGLLFPGWLAAGLAVFGLALPRAQALAGLRGDPRLALAIAAIAIVALATGGNMAARMAVLGGGEMPPLMLPNPFAWLVALIPVLGSVRLPSALGAAWVLLAALWAGFGAAALLRSLPASRRRAAAVALVFVAWLAAIGPALLGREPRLDFRALPLRPPEPSLALFSALERVGNAGPLLELPIDRSDKSYSFVRAPEQQLLSAWHGRRTSGCYVSHIPASVRELADLGPLDSATTLAHARDLGFTTVVVHHAPGTPGHAAGVRVLAEARRAEGLVRLAGTPALTVFSLAPAASGRAGSAE